MRKNKFFHNVLRMGSRDFQELIKKKNKCRSCISLPILVTICNKIIKRDIRKMRQLKLHYFKKIVLQLFSCRNNIKKNSVQKCV